MALGWRVERSGGGAGVCPRVPRAPRALEVVRGEAAQADGQGALLVGAALVRLLPALRPTEAHLPGDPVPSRVRLRSDGFVPEQQGLPPADRGSLAGRRAEQPRDVVAQLALPRA